MKLIIDAHTGTVLSADDCYIVDSEHPEADIVERGSDSEIGAFAKRVGKSVTEMGQDTGWGDNRYRWSVSYSPNSLRDEAEVWIDGLFYSEGDPEYDAVAWMRTASDDELAEIADWIMANDYVWDGFKDNVITNLIEFYETEAKP